MKQTHNRNKIAGVKKSPPSVCLKLDPEQLITPQTALVTIASTKITQFVAIAQREGIDPLVLLHLDDLLTKNGDHSHAEQAKELSLCYKRLCDLIRTELDNSLADTSAQKVAKWINECWELYIKKYNGKETDAAYDFELAVSTPSSRITKIPPISLDLKQFIEVFKLFNADLDTFRDFVLYVEQNLPLTPITNLPAAKKIIFVTLLKSYISQNENLDLNPESRIFSFARHARKKRTPIFNEPSDLFEQYEAILASEGLSAELDNSLDTKGSKSEDVFEKFSALLRKK